MLVEETYPPQDWAARASAVQVALKSSASMESVAFRMIFRPSWGSRSALFCTASDRSEVPAASAAVPPASAAYAWGALSIEE